MKDYEDFPNWVKCSFHHDRTSSLRGQRMECNGLNKNFRQLNPWFLFAGAVWGDFGSLSTLLLTLYFEIGSIPELCT